jgi:hypothetical protein
MCAEKNVFTNLIYPWKRFIKVQRMKYPLRVFQKYKRLDKRFHNRYFELINQFFATFLG